MISVIMPVYNSENTVVDAVNSVLRQSYKNFELICIDDCSTDDSFKLLSQIEDSRLILLRNNRNKGVSFSRNIGLNHAKGRFIAFLDSDDLWLPNKLNLQYQLLKDGHGAVHSYYYRMYDGFLGLVKSKEIVSYRDMLYHNFIPNLTGIYDTEKTQGIVFQDKIRHEDYDMWLNVILHTTNSIAVKEPLAIYRVSNNSISSNKLKSIIWHYKIIRRRVSFFSVLWYLFIHISLSIYIRMIAFFRKMNYQKKLEDVLMDNKGTR